MSTSQGSHGEYIIPNFCLSGYQLVVIATTFASVNASYQPGVDQHWGAGDGNSWIVDYKPTSTTFWALVTAYSPVAIMSFSRNNNDQQWILESAVSNLPQVGWYLDTWNSAPFVGGAPDDPAKQPKLPNFNKTPEAPDFPPDATLPAFKGTTGIGQRSVPPAVSLLQGAISAAINKLPGNPVSATVNTVAMGTAKGDNYVSAFMGYHSVWAQSWSSATCKAGFHTHVGFKIPLSDCVAAFCVQLATVIEWLG